MCGWIAACSSRQIEKTSMDLKRAVNCRDL